MEHIIKETTSFIKNRDINEWVEINNMFTHTFSSIKDFTFYFPFFQYHFSSKQYYIPSEIKSKCIDNLYEHGAWRNPFAERNDLYTPYCYTKKGSMVWKTQRKCTTCRKMGKDCSALYEIIKKKEENIVLMIKGMFD